MTADRRPRVRGGDVIAPRAGVASVVVDHETVIYDETTNSLHVLDRIATVIWSCLDGEGTLDEITVDLAEAFGAPLPQIRSDVRALVRRLDRLGLVDGVGGVPGYGGVGGAAPVAAGGRARSRSRYLREAPNL